MNKILELLKKCIHWIIRLINDNKGFILVLISIVVIRYFVIDIDLVVGTSMEPTLADQDVVVLDSKVYKLTKLDRFDVIVFDADDSEVENLYVKRVVGMPGEVVEIRDGVLFIDDTEVEVSEEISRMNLITGDFKSEVIPEDHYFVLGDNRTVSLDSRSSEVGFVSNETIKGHVFFRTKPYSDFGFIK